MQVVKLILIAAVSLFSTTHAFAQDESHGIKLGNDLDLVAMYKPIKDANELLSARKYSAAEQAFRSVRPDFLTDEVALGLGESLMGQKRYAEALRAYETLPPNQLKRRDSKFSLRYAVALYAVGRRSEAMDLYARSVASIPASMPFGGLLLPLSFEPHSTTFRQFEADARTAAAFAYLRNEQSDEALAQTRRALELIPDHFLARSAQALALLKIEPETALQQLEALAKVAPDPVNETMAQAMPSFRKKATAARERLDADAKKPKSDAGKIQP